MWGGLRRPFGPFQVHCVLAATMVVAAFSISPTYAQNARNRWVPEKQNFGTFGERLNANTVTIVADSPNGTYLSIADDLAAVLDDGEDFRILPLVGRGAGQNIRDVRFLKNVDLGITQTNLLNAVRRTHEIGGLDGRIVYIAKLFSEEMHLVVRSDSGITSIEQLAGKKVSFGGVGSGTQLSARDIFSRLKIKVDEVNLGEADATEGLKSGQIAATILIAGKPAAAITSLRADQGFRILPVPFAKQLQNDYLPATLGNEDYPGIIASGEEFETVAVGAVLIAYNWPKGSEPYRRLEDFVGRLFSRISEFQKPARHPKWREVNFAAVLPDWARFPPAEEWLARNRQELTARAQFNEFLNSRKGSATVDTQEERARLFLEFVKWSQTRGQR